MSIANSTSTNGGAQIDHHVTGWRIVAAFIDFIPLAILFAVMAVILGDTETEGSSFNASLNGWQALHFLALTIVYYTVLEAVTGTTIGKAILGLKVVALDGERYGLKSALIRNFMRLIDGLPILYLVGIVSIGMTTWRQRLGDIAAGTQVVRVLPLPVAQSGQDDGRPSPRPDFASPTDGTWKVSVIPRTIVAIAGVALISGVSIYLSPASASEPAGTMPGNAELETLTTRTLLDFESALQANNFRLFYEGISELWKNQTSAVEIKDTFQPFVDRDLSFAGVKNVSPEFDRPPAINEGGILILSGYYATSPLHVSFDLEYAYEDPSWKLTSIGVNIVAAPMSETPGPVPSQEELAELAKDTLLEFDRAVQVQDFTFFHSGLSALLKLQTTPSELATVFQEFVTRNISITGIKDIQPVFTAPPAINDQGFLALTGYYPTSPSRVLFNLNYHYEQLQWKLTSIKIDLAE